MATQAPVLLIARAGPLADGLTSLLSATLGVSLLPPAHDLNSALDAVGLYQPLIVVLDCALFGDEVASVILRLRADSGDCKFIALADDVPQQRAAKRAGADVVLLTGCRPVELAAVVAGCLPPDYPYRVNQHLA